MTASNQYLARATFVASFALDREIRYKVGDIERYFQSVLSAQAVGTNVADSAPAPIPRFTLQSGPKQIAVSQVSAQLDMDFTEQVKTADKLFGIVEKNFGAFWDGVCKLKKLEDLKEIGMVLTVNTPQTASKTMLSQELFDRYFKAPQIGEVASASFQVGYLDQKTNLFNNIAISPYEIREGMISNEAGQPGMLSIEVEKLRIRETGIETKMDVNSKPMLAARQPVTAELGQLMLKELRSLVASRGKEFLSW